MITQGTLIYNEDKNEILHTHHALMHVNLSMMQFEKWNMTMYLAHLLNNVTEKKIVLLTTFNKKWSLIQERNTKL